ncbi:MAG TPA: hypothetical protein VEL76_41230 [Gemmataceae bacterium]|nr:hypothetical protein [Gemmataceae bacterium]
MRTIPVCVLLLVSSAAAGGDNLVYEGTWVTTNRKLDGPLICVVTDLGNNQWRGHFSGVWEGVEFSYTVTFRGPPDKLSGEARIDGADYQWTGTMSQESSGWFKGTFGGNRYLGSFALQRKVK